MTIYCRLTVACSRAVGVGYNRWLGEFRNAEEGTMKRHHPMCEHSRCDICMEDHMALERLLREKCGGGNVDWLSKYHTFMKTRTGGAETAHGWATPESFDDANIEAFVAGWSS